MAKILPAALAAASLLVGGCSSDSQSALASEVNALTKVGEPLDTAAKKLRSAGFRCYQEDHVAGPAGYVNNVAADVECSRDRTYYLVATCIQRVNVWGDKPTKAVTRLDVPSPNCAGF